MDPEAFGKWLSGEIGVAAHVSFWVAVSVAAFLIWRAMEWRYAGMIERLRDERDSLLRREHHTHAELRVQAQTGAFQHVWGKTEDGSGQLTLRFAEPEWPRVEALTIEETVTFIGSIKELSQHEVVLVECEFADDAS